MHFKQPMHLVDIQGHEQSDDDTQHILVQVRSWQGQLDRIISQQGESAYTDSNRVSIVVVRQQYSDDKKAGQETVHQPVRTSFDLSVEVFCLRS